MIDVGRFFRSDAIIPQLKAETRDEVIKELVDRIYDCGIADASFVGRAETYKAVIERENIQGTGIGNGLAFPHARIEGWKKFAVAMGVSDKGIDFNSTDSKPAKITFLLISSPDEPYLILQTMAAIIRFINEVVPDQKAWEGVAAIRKIVNYFKERGLKATEVILARDIARPVVHTVTVETSIEDVTRIMHLHRQDVLPVVDHKNVFKGEVSCLEIFEFGMPDFFRQLNTVSFVRNIDPFEKYYRIKKNLKVRDIYIKEATPIHKDTTLLEIIFDMTIKGRTRLFMTEEDGTLSGVIDRFCIIDKVLFF